jgi:hypothetical protein
VSTTHARDDLLGADAYIERLSEFDAALRRVT